MTSDENKVLVRRFIEELWNKGNLAVADELLTPEVAEHYKERATKVRSEVPDVEITIEEMVAEGDLVATFETVRGNHRGGGDSLADLLVATDHIPPARKPVTVARAVFYRLVAGKITVVRRVGDNFGLFQQLGASASPAQTRAGTDQGDPAESTT